MYQLEGPDLDGQWRNFEKPWFSTLLMFAGMALCLPLVPLVSRIYRALEMGVRRVATGLELEAPLLEVLAAREPGQEPAREQQQEETGVRLRSCLLVLLPTAFDLTATLMMSVGLLYVTASTYAMVRGSEILFTAGLSVAFLHRRLNPLHLVGLALCTVSQPTSVGQGFRSCREGVPSAVSAGGGGPRWHAAARHRRRLQACGPGAAWPVAAAQPAGARRLGCPRWREPSRDSPHLPGAGCTGRHRHCGCCEPVLQQRSRG